VVAWFSTLYATDAQEAKMQESLMMSTTSLVCRVPRGGNTLSLAAIRCCIEDLRLLANDTQRYP
jgi:hypothetical protein